MTVNRRTANPIRIEVGVRDGSVELPGFLAIPEETSSIVLFAQGNGRSSMSSRTQFVGRVLNDEGLTTLMVGLRPLREGIPGARRGRIQCDLDLIADGLVAAIDWLGTDERTRGLKIGLFGSGSGGAAALVAAARRVEVGAVVLRGGRPDLAGPVLGAVEAPTLFIVGGRDSAIIILNDKARDKMAAKPRLEIVPGASHLFEEPGALEEVARLACNWFRKNLTARPPRKAATETTRTSDEENSPRR